MTGSFTTATIRSGNKPAWRNRRIFASTFNLFKLNNRNNEKILIPVSIVAILLCASWKEDAKTVSPDRLFLADSGKSLFVTNRAGNELIKMSSDGQKAEQKVTLSSPVNAMTQDPSGNLWVVCDGNTGMMYELDGKKLSVQSKQRAVLRLRISCIVRCPNHFG